MTLLLYSHANYTVNLSQLIIFCSFFCVRQYLLRLYLLSPICLSNHLSITQVISQVVEVSIMQFSLFGSQTGVEWGK